MSAGAGDLALACVGLLVDELVRAGAAEACICPGSRSTPIALALARHPAVRTHVHLDERSAAFFALGIARATGRPVVVACSSGTAVANLLPAVVEAAQDRVPLVVLSADRPPELRATGANQAIDQLGIFGSFATFFEAGVPEQLPGAANYWRSLGAHAAAAASGPPAGVVHVNLALREPLVPTGAAVHLGDAAAGRPGGQAWERVAAADDPGGRLLDQLAEMLDGVERGLLLVGHAEVAGDEVIQLATRLRWPLLAEPGSGLRRSGSLGAAQHLIADPGFSSTHRPDLVLQVGPAPTTRAGLALVAAAEQLVVVDPDRRSPDPGRRATLTVRADPGALARGLLDRCPARESSPWADDWQCADQATRAVVTSLLDGWVEPFQGRVARDVHAALPAGGTLVVANSLPVRDLDAFAVPRDAVRVLGNRGASGIDGFVSTALGVAAVAPPVIALAGDLSLLHDLSGLAWGARKGVGAVIVVINNGGGGIFDLLPQVALPEYERLFLTPHGADIGALSRAAGARHHAVQRAADLLPALATAAAGTGLAVIEVEVDRALEATRRGALREAVTEVLAGLVPAGRVRE